MAAKRLKGLNMTACFKQAVIFKARLDTARLGMAPLVVNKPCLEDLPVKQAVH
jgi:hypothetical protein